LLTDTVTVPPFTLSLHDALPILRHPANDFVVDFIGKKRLQQEQDVPLVEEVMVKKPVSIYPNRGLAQAMQMMGSRQVDSLVVVDDDDRVEGYVSIYDVT